ncbi:MAG: hypothetical protein ABSE71_02465 [Candidatus Micrarchaeaceae archaeon]|jgi:hypothetical protein|nr:hypothetical protein [Candidatus Micrarchaeota archaeon]HII09967.1 hypothetical protein [Candidatus Micrarchaeota archaeon]
MSTISIANSPQPMLFPSIVREELAELAKGTLPPINRTDLIRFELRSKLRRPPADSFGSIMILEEQLYRGSRRPGQTVFRESSVTFIAGVFLCLDKESAKSYAVNGAGIPLREELKANPPVVYTCSIEKLNLLDLRTKVNVDTTVKGFAHFLNRVLRLDSLPLLASLDRNWTEEEARILSNESLFGELVGSVCLSKDSGGMLSKMQKKLNGTFAEYLIAFGLDGVITEDRDLIVFDADKVKITGGMQVDPRLRSFS